MTAPSFAVFVSPHGFGHAARASAVMASLHRRHGARFQLFGRTPRWFFDETVAGAYDHHEVVTDVGFRQRSALHFDLDATVAALDAYLPFDEAEVDRLAATVVEAGCSAVLCDIAPLGIAVAERAGLPSLLVENFLWPWLYAPLFDRAPGLAAHADRLQGWFDRATLHVQAEPVCAPDSDALRVAPVSRPRRSSRAEVRSRLDVPQDAPLLVLTMGGVPQEYPFLEALAALDPVHVVVTGAPSTEARGTLRLFEAETRIYMPDFVGAADAVVAKLGYSTVAEVWAAGRPFGYVPREDFRESPPLAAWVEERMPALRLPADEFESGRWLERVPELLALPASSRGAAVGSVDRTEGDAHAAPGAGPGAGSGKGAEAVADLLLDLSLRPAPRG